MSISAIVEGHGDEPAVRILANRMLDSQSRWDIRVQRVKNAKGKPQLMRKFENFVEYALYDEDCQAVLVVVDADNDCPVDLAKGLSARAAARGLQTPIAIVVPHREFEAWFIAALDESADNPVRARLHIAPDVRCPDDPDAVGNPKGWLRRNMRRSRSYAETDDQPALADALSIELASARSRSFRRLEHALQELLAAIDGGAAIVTPEAAQ